MLSMVDLFLVISEYLFPRFLFSKYVLIELTLFVSVFLFYKLTFLFLFSGFWDGVGGSSLPSFVVGGGGGRSDVGGPVGGPVGGGGGE